MFECYLTDIKGNILNPYSPGSVKYTPRILPHDAENIAYVLIEGYVAVSESKHNMSEPIPFKSIKSFKINAPNSADMHYLVNSFSISCTPCLNDNANNSSNINIVVYIGTSVTAKEDVNINVSAKYCFTPQFDYTAMCISAKKIYDKACFKSDIAVKYELIYIKDDIYQYNAAAVNGKRIYTNADELTEYGQRGILSPNEVSSYSLFINSVLQPHAYYDLQEGYLELKTLDTPQNGEHITVMFETYTDKYNKRLSSENNQCSFISDGIKRKFTDADIISTAGITGIPDTKEVSYCNLYINGVIQPEKNYIVKKGVLELLTENIPMKEEIIVLESVNIRNNAGILIHAQIYMYNAVSNGGKIYTNNDEIITYGNKGILDPDKCTCYNLYINGSLQPKANYYFYRGNLILSTEDVPAKGCIISLQFIIAIQ